MKFEEVADPGQTILAHVSIVVRRMCEDFNQRQASAVHLLAGPVDCDGLLLQIQLARLNRRRRLIFLDQLWFSQSQYDTSASCATQAHVCLIDELQGYAETVSAERTTSLLSSASCTLLVWARESSHTLPYAQL